MNLQSLTSALLSDLKDDEPAFPVSLLAMEGCHLLIVAGVLLQIGHPVSIETPDQLILGHIMALDETIGLAPRNGNVYVVYVDHLVAEAKFSWVSGRRKTDLTVQKSA
jgi:hypothetical protein